MKPTSQVHPARRQRGPFASRRQGSSSLQTDCHFQSTAAYFSGGGSSAPSFRGISRDYFEHEARGHFASEAILFGLMVATAAIPVIEGIRGLAHFVYGVL